MDIYGNKISCDIQDLEFIKTLLAKLPHKQLMTGLINKYSEVYQAHDNTLQGQGIARREANSRLRRYIAKVVEAQK
jgi:hypothetical protein